MMNFFLLTVIFVSQHKQGSHHRTMELQGELKAVMAGRRGDMAHTAANEVLSSIDYDGVGGLGLPPDPVGAPRLTWRDPVGSDAEIVLGTTKYTVHRSVLCKEGKADMLRRQLQSEGASFDLSTLLPKACWDVLPLLLDFLYDDFFNPGVCLCTVCGSRVLRREWWGSASPHGHVCGVAGLDSVAPLFKAAGILRAKKLWKARHHQTISTMLLLAATRRSQQHGCSPLVAGVPRYDAAQPRHQHRSGVPDGLLYFGSGRGVGTRPL